MFDQPALHRPAPDMTYEQMLQAVQYQGAYPDTNRTAASVHRVLAALGRRLTGPERVDLAARLPPKPP